VPGGDVIYDSPDDKLANVPDLLNNGSGNTFPSFDEGGSIYPGGIDKNPAKIMNLTPHPQSGLNPTTYPVDPKTCKPIAPWDFPGQHDLPGDPQRRHADRVLGEARRLLVVQRPRLGRPEHRRPLRAGDRLAGGRAQRRAVPGRRLVDGRQRRDQAVRLLQGQGVVNWINGYEHSGTGPKVGTPAIYGMNFQTISTAEKLKSSAAVLIGPNAQGKYTEGPSLPGGYVSKNGVQVPGPLLQSALNYVNHSLQRMVDTIQADGEASSTAIVLTAKHGQSPRNHSKLKRIDDGPIISGVNTAWAATHPSNPTLVVQTADDDGLLWWLSDRSRTATEFGKNYLWTHSAPAVNYAGKTITVQHSGLVRIFAGEEPADFFGVANSDPHHPDVFGISQVGTVYTTGSKIAEHGGDNPGDRHVPLVVYAPGHVPFGQSDQWVENTQVAPTILKLLGLDPNQLQAVREEGTKVLPGLGGLTSNGHS
jgi:hypothetical protein